LSEKAPETPREFKPIKDPEEAFALLNESAHSRASAMIWTKGQTQVITTTILTYSRKEQYMHAAVPKEVDASKFAEVLAKSGSQECFFSVSLSRANIFFKARYLGHDEEGFRFDGPEIVFKVQRRKDMRVQIPSESAMRLEMQDPTFPEQKLVKKVYDISASGLAFIANVTEEALFPKGIVLKSLTFTIGTRKISVDAEVRHVRELPPSSGTTGTQVGVLFLNMRPADNQWVAAYVFEETRKYMT
jgi:hypothetical protein